jgi:hypothetical protein
LADYAKWDGRFTYSAEEIEGRVVKLPFEHDPEKKICTLSCRQGFWSNIASNFNRASDGNDQRCTFDNCKDWDYSTPGTTSQTCKTCWTKADLDTYAEWDGRSSYTREELEGQIIEIPFVKNTDNICELQCGSGYWSNAKSTFGRASNGNDQRCTYNNCKQWNFKVSGAKNNACTECWNIDDIAAYSSWDVRSDYSLAEVLGMNQKTPFKIDNDTNQCQLQCADGYWSNFKSSFNRAANANDQRCTSDNCKDWDYFSGTGLPTTCTRCWIYADMAKYNDWDGK